MTSTMLITTGYQLGLGARPRAAPVAPVVRALPAVSGSSRAGASFFLRTFDFGTADSVDAVGERVRSVRVGRSWRLLVPVLCVVAGFGFAASASAARGTDLRSPQTVGLTGLVRSAEQRVGDASGVLSGLQSKVADATRRAAVQDAGVAAAQQRSAPLQAPAGLTAVAGPGLTVVLDDAHGTDGSGLSAEEQNQLVVHQSDLQAVVNALWAGGADAVSVAGQRLVATSAIRCVGNTLLLNGRVYSPPYRVLAIGPAAGMQAGLDRSPGVALFRQAAGYYGLGYTVARQDRVQVPAYTGPVQLTYATAAPR